MLDLVGTDLRALSFHVYCNIEMCSVVFCIMSIVNERLVRPLPLIFCRAWKTEKYASNLIIGGT